MTDECFKKEIFERINTAYKLLKPLQELKPYGNDAKWEQWVNSCDEYCKTIDNPSIQSAVNRFLIDMGDCISHLNRDSGGNIHEQK